MITYAIFDIQLMDRFNGGAISTSGGMANICQNLIARQQAVYDPDNDFVALTQPVAFSGGKLRFAVQMTGGQPSPPVVDIYAMGPLGNFFVINGAKPGAPDILSVDTSDYNQVAVIPFSVPDCVPGTEQDTGIVLPKGCVVDPFTTIDLLVASGAGSKTISAGLLSTQSGGDAAGFCSSISLTGAGQKVVSLHGGSPTAGTLLQENSGAGSTAIPEPYVVGATAKNISYTLTSGATFAQGFINIAYRKTFAQVIF